MDIGTEELSHLEVVGALIRMHLKPMKSDRAAAEADPLVSIAGGGGVALFNSMGDAWTADYLKVTGDLAVDLHSNIAAEARAKIVYERLINFTDDQGTKEALQFLMTREITHMRAFTAALETMGKPRFSIGTIAPTAGLVDEFFNDSTGTDEETGSSEGQIDSILEAAKLQKVDSPMFGGDGLNVEPDTPVPNSETTSKVDSTPVGGKRPPAKSERETRSKKTGTRSR
jgi:Mn-containing catalase